MFWSQLKKELMTLRGDLLLSIGGFLLWAVFLHTRMTLWEPWLTIGLAWLPQLFVPVWIVWNSVHVYRHEWTGNTHYLMLSLPVRAWRISLPKLAALAVGALVLVVVIAALALTVAPRALEASPELQVILNALPEGWLLSLSLQIGAATFCGSFLLAIVTQFAYVFSRLFERFQWLLMAWTWILTLWTMEKFVNLVSPLFRWLPDLRIRWVELVGNEFVLRPATLDSTPILATAVFALLLALLINVVIERAVEV